jgi:molybdenum-dependent DNA-binding transcriptional regulator ModE
MAESIDDRAERYMREIKKMTDEAAKAFERSMNEADLLGRRMYDDIRDGMQDSGSKLNNVSDRMIQDFNREMPKMVEEVKRWERRVEKQLDDIRKELEKSFK